MAYIMQRMSDGLYLDTNYHSRITHGIWRPQPRIYKSLQGIRSAWGWTVPQACVHLRKLIGEEIMNMPHRTYDDNLGQWTDADRQQARDFWDAFTNRLKKIKTKEFIDTLAKDGYIVSELCIGVRHEVAG